MKVSVIIPTYNRHKFLKKAISSVQTQLEQPDEIIVVDDGSTDDTENVVEQFLEKVTYIWQKNNGVSSARNLGIRKAQNEWLAFLDSDDLWKPKKLLLQKNALQQNPHYKLCYTNEEWRRDGKWINPKRVHKKFSGWIYERCLPLCIISPSSLIIHKSVFDTVGLFDENLPACEDYDMWLRITHLLPILYLKEKLIVKRAGEWDQLSDQHSLDKYRIIALDKMLKSKTLQPENRRKTLNMLNSKCDIYKNGCLKHGQASEAVWAETMKNRYKTREPDK